MPSAPCMAASPGTSLPSRWREVFQGQTAWVGIVEEFALTGHPKATTCYAWSYRDGGTTHTTTVLALPPVDSPEIAVKVAIAAEAKG